MAGLWYFIGNCLLWAFIYIVVGIYLARSLWKCRWLKVLNVETNNKMEIGKSILSLEKGIVMCQFIRYKNAHVSVTASAGFDQI